MSIAVSIEKQTAEKLSCDTHYISFIFCDFWLQEGRCRVTVVVLQFRLSCGNFAVRENIPDFFSAPRLAQPVCCAHSDTPTPEGH